MQFTKKLREPIKRGVVTTSIRIWKRPHVKVGSRYALEEGAVIITSMQEIGFDDISESMARASGFNNLLDLMKTAKHGDGHIIYFITFRFESQHVD